MSMLRPDVSALTYVSKRTLAIYLAPIARALEVSRASDGGDALLNLAGGHVLERREELVHEMERKSNFFYRHGAGGVE
jgi:hypothetical protein